MRARTPAAGVGKTTCIVQLSAAYAVAHPDVSVLVVDFSIHGDCTSQLLGARRYAARCASGEATTSGWAAARMGPVFCLQLTLAALRRSRLRHACVPHAARMRRF
jgi:Mrp family chromosome partitioning ATPase